MQLIVAVLLLLAVAVSAGDMLMKSIVFDKKTPGVFYCPQHKPTGLDKMIVRSRPLKKLCEFDNKKPLPSDYKSDCYHDIDESEWACKEKYRIMKRLKEPKEDNLDQQSQYS
uniref:Putative conserved secreted protein n=1 Tax=Panstrongylus megistus TaxID=65343 RepID=A0A069DMP4_9HEMI